MTRQVTNSHSSTTSSGSAAWTPDGSQLSSQDLSSLFSRYPALFLETFTTTKGTPTKLEPYQINFLNDQSKFRAIAKSRQIGYSWIISAEGLHKIIFSPGKKVNYVSINQKEASDKINYAKQFYHTIPEVSGFKAPIYTSAEFEFSVHEHPNTSYLVSQPASAAIRGGEKDVYFDEFAFVRDAKKLYDAAIPATTRGNSRMTVVSTPLGQSGLFFDIVNDRQSYPDYSVHIVPWWECSIMSRDVAESTAIAPDYDTQTRVEKWGTGAIKSIFLNMGLDAFQQEYECNFADEAVNYYPWSTIVSCVDDELNGGFLPPELSYSIGIDLAKKVDKTVITIASHDEETGVSTIHKTFETRDSYEEQERAIERLIDSINPQRVTVDATGVGEVIAEKLKAKYGGRIEDVTFDVHNKQRWATAFKGDLQTKKVRYPRNRDLLKEIHNIERTKSEAGNYLFKAKSGEHDDYYWSAMLAIYGRGRTPPSISFAW